MIAAGYLGAGRPKPDSSSDGTVRIATWNVNGLRARLDFLRHWLRDRRPDVVGLQELKLTDEQFPHAELSAEGYRAVSHGQKSWNGVAILSRDAAEVSQRGLPGQEELGARLITADVGGLSFTTIYCPNGKHVGHDDFPRKLAWFDALAQHFEERCDPERPAILCGDFNVCPAALDSWNEEQFRGEIFHTDEERARFRRLLALGLRRPLPRPAPRCAGLLVVGLPRRRLPPEAGAAHRLPARHARRLRARPRGRDRPRVPQEEGRPHGLRPRPGLRGPRRAGMKAWSGGEAAIDRPLAGM